MINELDAQCSECGGALRAEIESAAHDNSLLDITVHCCECERVLNSFTALNDMTVLGEGDD